MYPYREPFVHRVSKLEDIDRLSRKFGRPPDLDFIGGHEATKYRIIAWGDETFLRGLASQHTVYHVNRAPFPVMLAQPQGYYAQAKKENEELFHSTMNPWILKRMGKLVPRYERHGYYYPIAYVVATTNPWRYNAPFGSEFFMLNRWVYRIAPYDRHKFRPVIYKLRPSLYPEGIETVRKAGYRIMTPEEILREYGADWWKYEYTDMWIDENEWRSFEPVDIEYLGRKGTIKLKRILEDLLGKKPPV